ncbi:MAG: BamA/TamA family outer membrane protein [Candidatus Krumholzibacteria bacterium]|nr:BamA/TamA family outer membrane protein [Candidatus Krumholzibacteria bacterium]
MSAVFLVGVVSVALAQADDSHVYGQTVTEIRVIGLKTTKPYIVERELSTKVGEPFTKENEKTDYEHLDRLQIFSEILIYTALDDDGGLVVFVEVQETFAYLPVVSLAISDENGLSIGGGLKSVNLFGRAIQSSTVARFGGETTVEIIFKDPWVAGSRLGYIAEYYYRNRDNEIHGFFETANEAYLLVSQHVGEHGRAGARMYYHGIQSDMDGKTLSSNNTDHVIYGTLIVGYDSRDLHSNPHTGWWSMVDITRSGLFGTDSDYWQGNFDLRRFQPLGRSHTLGLFSLYTTTSGAVNNEVASWQTFGLGGSNSIRGYDVGTKVGKNQFINTVEYRWNFMQPRPFKFFGVTLSMGMQLAFFTDFGSAWNTREEFNPNFIWGGGTGLRLIVPYVGLIRCDFGFGQDDPWLIVHFASGEKAERQRERVR